MNNLIRRLSSRVVRRENWRRCCSSGGSVKEWRRKIPDGPDLKHFMGREKPPKPFVMKWNNQHEEPYIDSKSLDGNNTKVFIRTYGCQMNVNDTEIASTILANSGYQLVDSFDEAEIAFLMTCAIRENAESRVWTKLHELEAWKKRGQLKKFGLLGCMAERLKTKVLDEIPSIDIIAGPDSYRHLPKLIAINELTGQNAVNVMLSLDETYEDVLPKVVSQNSAFVSITRGCNNMCSYCIVPYTRGRERSRPINSILKEVEHFSRQGIKEITLLGQNVNSYRDYSENQIDQSKVQLADGFRTIYKLKSGGIGFDILLDQVAQVNPDLRIRFTSPHPKDFNDNVLAVIAKHANIAKGIHLPIQSGSNLILERMRRGYTREVYLNLVARIGDYLPGCGLSSDFICGFCGETEDDHRQTLEVMDQVGYYIAYIFAYSMRDKTHAYHKLKDDVPQEVKIRRLMEVNRAFRAKSEQQNRQLIGTKQLLLLEGESKRSTEHLYGRNEANQKVIVPKKFNNNLEYSIGDFLVANITGCTSMTLYADPIEKSSITKFYSKF